MFSFLKAWRFRRIAFELAQEIASEAWRAMPRICEESEDAVEVLKSTGEGSRIWEGVSVVMAFGVHVVDHYARNFLDDPDRSHLVRKILSRLLSESTKTSAALAAKDEKAITAKELKGGEQALLNLMRGTIDKFERSNFMHIGGPEYRGDSGQTSVTWCGMMLMSVFIAECDVPRSKLDAWEEMDPKTLKLYDIGRAVAWEVHQQMREHLYRLLAAEGFRQVRDLGTALRV